ncbi:uncharacterized protein THITE_37820 [Thermothielavioides terrestris NRRL 8126]|uniref:Serine hydrolase domain-containing protein n=1 Tax=Thermothielavioides terrestris (strain ATCC 38088 / NRRL 8126) TaxID=578455 RepID=G2R1C9_THETT|nr:uncharacterized protein THITE_37820 [Thermothielavioides terrestris NRRL 8126]AEO64864.1 hypothetical protein THITE_37820 [Thermothielavioides terrestris NRRL 8126]
MGDNAAASDPPSGTDSPAQRATPRMTPKSSAANNKRVVRILMLHGFTQSGPLFRAKTRALEKLLAKALAPAGLVPALLYPTAPNRLSPRDVPGYQPPPLGPSTGAVAGEEGDGGDGDEGEMDAWAWFRRDDASGRYRFLEEGMVRVAEAVRDGSGGIDGVIGFSQGGCMAAMLASAMEEGRAVGAPEHERWVSAVRAANGGRPLKFAVIYSGFYAVPEDLAWLYKPPIRTPTLHFLGSLDTVVDESRSQGLVERCQDPVVLTHPGGHYVPISKEWAMPLAGFIKKCVESAGDGTKL